MDVKGSPTAAGASAPWRMQQRENKKGAARGIQHGSYPPLETIKGEADAGEWS